MPKLLFFLFLFQTIYLFTEKLPSWKWHSLNSGPETLDPKTRDSRTWDPGTMRPGSCNPGTLGTWFNVPRYPGLLNWDPGRWVTDTQDPGTRSLELGTCYPKAQNPESRTLRIELMTQISSIPTRTTVCTNINYEA